MWDIHRLRKNQTATALLGALLAILLVGVGVVVVADFSGDFSDDPQLTVQLPVDGSVVADGSPVKYLDITVGKVLGAANSGRDARPEARISIGARWLGDLPAGITATVGPVSIFGNQYVILEPPGGTPAAGHYRSGDVIPAAGTGNTPSLQSTFVSLDDVLKQISPAKLNTGLSGIANALDGQGAKLGKTLVDLNQYLGQMLPLWPTVVQDLGELARLARSLNQDVPGFLQLVANATRTSQTLTRNSAAYDALIGGGAALANQSATLLRETSQAYADTISGAVPLLQALSQGPDLVNRTLAGLDKWASAWAKVLASGTPNVTLAPLSVARPADLLLAIVSGGSNSAQSLNAAIRPGFADPSTYPGCPAQLCPSGAATNAERVTRLTAAAGDAGAVSAAQAQAATTLLLAHLGLTPRAADSVETLQLAPLLLTGGSGGGR